jgi:PAS domain S-box-containing protein
LQSASVTVSPDLRAERRFRDAFLQGMGLAAALVVPLHVNGKPFGVLGTCAKAPREFTLDDVTFAETMAHLLSASIARIQMEQKLQEADAIRSGLLEMVDTMVLTLDAEGRVVDMNRACEEMTKFHLAEVLNKPFWQMLVAPEESDLVRVIFRSSQGSQIPSEFEGFLLAKDGTRRKVSWSLKVLSTGQVQTILMTGREQPPQVEAAAELEQIKAAAAQTTGAPTAASGGNHESPFHPTATDSPAVQKRGSARRDYRYRQRMAPMHGDALPAASEFVDVDCRDISASGISFFQDRLPTFETLVVGLGRPPALSYFSARVMRVARVEEDGTARYLIGCGFSGRIHLPKTRI